MPDAGAMPPVGRPLRLAFVVDPLPALKPAKDSTVAMMRAAVARGHAVFAIACATLHWRGPGAGSPEGVCGDAVELTVHADDGAWYATREGATMPLAGFDAVLMRKDPPFDFEYLAATWLLERAEADGARIFNRPRALRDHSEKLAITEFPQFAPPTLVDRDAARLDAFIDAQGDAILKPLDGMGGSRIFRVRHDDPNRNVILETLTEDGRRTVMAQRYLSAIADGDKRILLVAGQVVPWALARIPMAGETRGNLAAGGRGVAQALSKRDRAIAEALAPVLWARGLLIVGLDVIGDHLTEINVTSPTCMVEIHAQTGFDSAAAVIAALEAQC
jgi:glutathione synthase